VTPFTSKHALRQHLCGLQLGPASGGAGCPRILFASSRMGRNERRGPSSSRSRRDTGAVTTDQRIPLGPKASQAPTFRDCRSHQPEPCPGQEP